MNKITESVLEYYAKRQLVVPNFDEAIHWHTTEVAEALELHLQTVGQDWVRNNPDSKELFSFEKLGEELGDAIMMLIMAGVSYGVCPLESLLQKMERKLNDS